MSDATTLPLSFSEDTGTISLSHNNNNIPILTNISPYIIYHEEDNTNNPIQSQDQHQHILLGAISISGLTSRLDIPLGSLNVSRFLALGRTSLWWMTPAWGSSSSDVPEETQFLLAQLPTDNNNNNTNDTNTNNAYVLMLPLLDTTPTGTFRATLHSPKRSSTVNLCIESGTTATSSALFPSSLLIVAGTDPYQLISRGVAMAAAYSGTAQPRSKKEMPPIADVFGWCTWDAFYSTVSAAGIMEGLGSLVKGGAPPGFLIIDDGWQQTDVDEEYRHSNSTSGSGSSNNNTKSDDKLQQHHDGSSSPSLVAMKADHAVHEMEEAVTDLLTGPGDPSYEQLKGEHQIQEEQQVQYNSNSSSTNSITTTMSKDVATKDDDKNNNKAATMTVSSSHQPYFSVLSVIKNIYTYILSKVESAIMHFGKSILDNSSSDSFIIRMFQSLAAGPLKPALLRFYAATTDHSRRLTSIKANAKFAAPSTGPGSNLSDAGGDLTAVVAAIKKRYGVKYVYAWHAMGAFWGGLGINDPGVKKYNPTLLQPIPTPSMLSTDPSVAWIQPVLCGLSLPLDPRPLHNDMHEYLSSCGIDGVKVDVQSTIGLAGSGTDIGGPSLASIYQSSLEESTAKHFPGNHLINCMCHSTENLYNMTDTNLARVSDDFYPQRPASHTAHIANCAYNSLFMGEIVGADWDMFHSKHPAAFLHAAARAISGGPVYVSDKPGHHDFSLLERLVLPDGRVLRCLLPARPTVDCLFADVMHDGKTALKLWNVNECNGVVGVFNIQGSSFSRQRRAFYTHDASPVALSSVVMPSDVAGMKWSEYSKAVMYSDKKKEFIIVDINDNGNTSNDDGSMNDSDMNNSTTTTMMNVEVEPRGGCDIITISPMQSINGSSNVSFSAIGLVNMINAGGAIKKCNLSLYMNNNGSSDGNSDGNGNSTTTSTTTTTNNNNNVRAIVLIKGYGEFLAYSSQRPVSIMINGVAVDDYEYDEKTGALQCSIVHEDDSSGDGDGDTECVIVF